MIFHTISGSSYFKKGEGIAGWVLDSNESLILPDAMADWRYTHNPHLDVRPHRAMVCTPLRCRNRIIGVLTLCNMDEAGVFNEEDVKLVSSFADKLQSQSITHAITMKSRTALERLEHNKSLSDALVRVSQKLAGSTDLEKQMEAVQQFLLKELHAPVVVLGIYNKPKIR